jgi:hypothetical protein
MSFILNTLSSSLMLVEAWTFSVVGLVSVWGAVPLDCLFFFFVLVFSVSGGGLSQVNEASLTSTAVEILRSVMYVSSSVSATNTS